jgi:hypothetical protein
MSSNFRCLSGLVRLHSPTALAALADPHRPIWR